MVALGVGASLSYSSVSTHGMWPLALAMGALGLSLLRGTVGICLQLAAGEAISGATYAHAYLSLGVTKTMGLFMALGAWRLARALWARIGSRGHGAWLECCP